MGASRRNHASSSWQESQALVYSGKAAMMLIGNFIVANFPPDMRDRMEFVAVSVDAPRFRPLRGRARQHAAHPGAGAQQGGRPALPRLRAARRRAGGAQQGDAADSRQSALAASRADRFIVQGRELLARADGLAQYFDRDTSEDLANIAMKGFQEFMLYPDRLDAILASIERARLRIYGALPAPSPAK